jgi:proteasome lid subunit RPN8/RPN11
MAQLVIPRYLLNEVISHCQEVYPKEACGILAGKDGVVLKVYKMRNIENSNISYMMNSKEQFTVMENIRKEGLDMTAIYHSHPELDPCPSPRDIQLASYPDSAYLIVGLLNNELKIKAFSIKEGKVEKVEVKVIEE